MSDDEGRLLRHDQSGRVAEVEVSQDGPSVCPGKWRGRRLRGVQRK